MTLLKTLLDRLPKLRKAKDFADVIPHLENRLMLAQATADDLKVDLKNALFASPEKRETVRNNIAANLAEQEDLTLAIAGARERQKEAAALEMEDEVKRRSSTAPALQDALRKAAVELHIRLTATAEALDKVAKISSDLRSVNDFVREHGRRDLVAGNPIDLLYADHPHGKYQVHPATLQLPGYYPMQVASSKGPVLGLMQASST